MGYLPFLGKLLTLERILLLDTMKYFVVACLLAASVSAITDIRDCGDANSVVRITGGSLTPDPVLVPGEMSVNLALTSSQEMPGDLLLIKHVQKVAPDHQHVKCLDGIHGSCTIDVCGLIATQPDLICPNFPPEVPCACPLPAGTFAKDGIIIHFDEAWLNLGFDVEGDYRVRFDLASASAPDNLLGCLEVDFSLAAA